MTGLSLPRGLRLRSLRARLLFWLVVVHLLVAVGVACFTYASFGGLILAFKEDQMRMLADSYAGNGNPPPPRAVDGPAARERGAFVVQIWSPDGRLIATSWPQLDIPLQAAPGLVSLRLGPTLGDEWRVLTNTPQGGPQMPRVQIIQSASFLQQLMVRRSLLAAAPVALLLPLSLAVLWLVVSISARRLHTVARDVAQQDESSIAELPVDRVPDEIAPLVQAFNTLLARLRAALATQRRFTQDAAHELRTPVTAIGLQLENLRAHIPAGDAAERFVQLEAGVTRAQHLIDQLLRLSRQESDTTAITAAISAAATTVDIAALLRDSVGQLMPLADRRRIDVGVVFKGSPAVHGFAPDLRSVFDNLIDNALRHSPEGGVVDVVVHDAGPGQPLVEVIDQGPGIPEDCLPRAFDRFFRVPGTPGGGSGLGLAIADMAARRHGLVITLANRRHADGRVTGLMARVSLEAGTPLAHPEARPEKTHRHESHAMQPAPTSR